MYRNEWDFVEVGLANSTLFCIIGKYATTTVVTEQIKSWITVLHLQSFYKKKLNQQGSLSWTEWPLVVKMKGNGVSNMGML